eukprot:681314-Amphidinium_carterae.1
MPTCKRTGCETVKVHGCQGLTPTGTKTFPCDAEVLRLLQSNAVDPRLQPFRSAAPASATAPASSHDS